MRDAVAKRVIEPRQVIVADEDPVAGADQAFHPSVGRPPSRAVGVAHERLDVRAVAIGRGVVDTQPRSVDERDPAMRSIRIENSLLRGGATLELAWCQDLVGTCWAQ